MDDEQARIAELTETNLKLRLYVVLATPKVPVGEIVRLLPEHFEYLSDLEKAGVLFCSGPFLEDGGTMPGSGMIIVRADSHEEAVSRAKQDPLYKAGMRSFEVKTWQLNEGSFSVRLYFSSGDYTVE